MSHLASRTGRAKARPCGSCRVALANARPVHSVSIVAKRFLEAARRRWGRARVLRGGPPRPKRPRRPKLPGTALERKLVVRLLGRSLTPEEMAAAIRLLRAGARIKELEINDRLETLLD